MKKLLACTLFIASAAAWAQTPAPTTPPKEGASFERHKEHMLKMEDQRIDLLQKQRSCLQAAQTKEAARACHEATHEAMQQLHPKHRDGAERQWHHRGEQPPQVPMTK